MRAPLSVEEAWGDKNQTQNPPEHEQKLKRVIEGRLKEFEKDKTEFGGKPAKRYLIQKNIDHWMSKRKTS
jgi:hypothetical protein